MMTSVKENIGESTQLTLAPIKSLDFNNYTPVQNLASYEQQLSLPLLSLGVEKGN